MVTAGVVVVDELADEVLPPDELLPLEELLPPDELPPPLPVLPVSGVGVGGVSGVGVDGVSGVTFSFGGVTLALGI